MGTQHTPGPWHIAEYGTNEDGTPKHYGIVRGKVTIANLGTSTNENAKEIDANARLIASAPEMLEALKILSDSLIEAIDISQINGKVPAYLTRWEAERGAVRALLARIEDEHNNK
jgi:hypothetical protein